MINQFKQALLDSIHLKKSLLDDSYLTKLQKVGDLIVDCIQNGNKVLFCGNGGSAADSQHLAAEMLVRLRPKVNRDALPALPLALDTSTITACGNDFGFDHLFERNLLALGKKNDILICISTSGDSRNIILAAEAAEKKGIITIGLLGSGGGVLKEICNNSILIPSDNTARIQECHITLGHIIIEYVEEKLLISNYISINK
jgi:D-sedoheptulose 7-phosphate isomerase